VFDLSETSFDKHTQPLKYTQFLIKASQNNNLPPFSTERLFVALMGFCSYASFYVAVLNMPIGLEE